MSTLSHYTTFTIQSCYACGIKFGMPDEFHDQRLRDQADWYCPNGHRQHYIGKTEAQKERERAERLERQLANKDEDLRSATASLRVTKGHVTRLRKRVAAGKCPWCSEQFPDLAGHVAEAHPGVEADQ